MTNDGNGILQFLRIDIHVLGFPRLERISGTVWPLSGDGTPALKQKNGRQDHLWTVFSKSHTWVTREFFKFVS